MYIRGNLNVMFCTRVFWICLKMSSTETNVAIRVNWGSPDSSCLEASLRMYCLLTACYLFAIRINQLGLGLLVGQLLQWISSSPFPFLRRQWPRYRHFLSKSRLLYRAVRKVRGRLLDCHWQSFPLHAMKHTVQTLFDGYCGWGRGSRFYFGKRLQLLRRLAYRLSPVFCFGWLMITFSLCINAICRHLPLAIQIALCLSNYQFTRVEPQDLKDG